MINDLTMTRQGGRLTGCLVNRGARIRSRIVRDFYDGQSSARVQHFTNDRGWVTIHDVDINDCKIGAVRPPLPDRDESWRDLMRHDLNELLDFGLDFMGITQ